MTITERIEAAKRMATCGGRGHELARRDLEAIKRDVQEMLDDIDIGYEQDGTRGMNKAIRDVFEKQ